MLINILKFIKFKINNQTDQLNCYDSFQLQINQINFIYYSKKCIP